MKILIIGNGFDLLHGLPTRYIDFMNFAREINNAYMKSNHKYNEDNISKFLLRWDKQSKMLPEDWIKNNGDKIEEMYKCIDRNIWYNYFDMLIEENIFGENWVDFESEMRDIIKYLDDSIEELHISYQALENSKISPYIKDHKEELYPLSGKLSIFRDSMRKCIKGELSMEKLSVDNLIDTLYDDLNRLIRSFELYTACLVDDLPVKHKKYIKNINPKYVINFNYTHIYQKCYNSGNKAKIFYIHGECNAERSADENNMVLGIDEYLDENLRNKKTNFSMFKKFFQRIRKRVRSSYVSEIQEEKKYNAHELEIVVIGHSLDVTDADILRRYLGDKKAKITIYGKDEKGLGALIANMIKIIGVSSLNDKYYDIDREMVFLPCPI